MSLRGHIWAWRAATSSTAERCVLAYLGEAHHNADGDVAIRAVETIAAAVHMSPRNVMRVTSALSKKGLIEVRRRGRGNVNHYRLIGLEDVVLPSDGVTKTAHQAPSPAPDEVTNGTDDVTSAPDEVTNEPDDVTPMSPSPGSPGTPGSPGSPAEPDAASVLNHLNSVAGSSFQISPSSIGPIRARMREGHSREDLMAVVDFKAAEWLDDPKMRQYLRPKTLFGSAEKFEGYLLAAKQPDGARAAWAAIRPQLADSGRARTEDPIAAGVVASMGGFTALGRLPERELGNAERDFIARYRTAQRSRAQPVSNAGQSHGAERRRA